MEKEIKNENNEDNEKVKQTTPYIQILGNKNPKIQKLDYISIEEITAIKFCLVDNSQENEELAIRQLINIIEKLGYTPNFNYSNSERMKSKTTLNKYIGKEALIIVEQLVSQTLKKVFNTKKEYPELFQLYENLNSKENNSTDPNKQNQVNENFSKFFFDRGVSKNCFYSTLIDLNSKNNSNNLDNTKTIENKENRSATAQINQTGSKIISSINSNEYKVGNRKSSLSTSSKSSASTIQQITGNCIIVNSCLEVKYSFILLISSIAINLLRSEKHENDIIVGLGVNNTIEGIITTRLAKVRSKSKKNLLNEIIEELETVRTLEFNIFEDVKDIKLVKPEVLIIFFTCLQSFFPSLLHIKIKPRIAKIENYLEKLGLALSLNIIENLSEYYRHQIYYTLLSSFLLSSINRFQFLETSTIQSYFPELAYLVIKSDGEYSSTKEPSKSDLKLKVELQTQFLPNFKGNKENKYIEVEENENENESQSQPEIISDEKIHQEKKEEINKLNQLKLLEKKEYQQSLFSVIDSFLLIDNLLNIDLSFNSLDSIIFEKINYFIYKGSNLVNLKLDFFNNEFSENFNRKLRKLLLELNLSGKSSQYLDYTYNDNYIDPSKITSQLYHQYNENLKILSVVFDVKLKFLSYLSFKFIPYTFVNYDTFISSANVFIYNLFISLSKYRGSLNMNSFYLETNFLVDFSFAFTNNKDFLEFTKNFDKLGVNVNETVIKKFTLVCKVSSLKASKIFKRNTLRSVDLEKSIINSKLISHHNYLPMPLINEEKEEEKENEEIENKVRSATTYNLGNSLNRKKNLNTTSNNSNPYLKDTPESNSFEKINLSLFSWILPINHVVELNLLYLTSSNFEETIMLIQKHCFKKLKILKTCIFSRILQESRTNKNLFKVFNLRQKTRENKH